MVRQSKYGLLRRFAPRNDEAAISDSIVKQPDRHCVSLLSPLVVPALSRDPYSVTFVGREGIDASVLTDGPRRMGPGSRPGRQ
jgi:hypothetical protein